MKRATQQALFALLLMIIPFAGAAVARAETITIIGDAFYRERIAIPDGSALHVQLIEMPQTAVEPTVAGKMTLKPSGQVPIKFSFDVDKARIDAGKSYGLIAQIEAESSIWFSSKEPVPVDLNATATPISLLLMRGDHRPTAGVTVPVEAPKGELVGTQWQLVSLGGKALTSSAKSLLTFAKEGGVNGNGGCNSFGGGYKLDGTSLKIENVFSTMMACEEAVSQQEHAFLEALRKTATYQITAGELVLKDEAAAELARLQMAQ